jgi:hypothetical protein
MIHDPWMTDHQSMIHDHLSPPEEDQRLLASELYEQLHRPFLLLPTGNLQIMFVKMV